MDQTIVVIEDHEIIRAGLRLLLERESGWRVVGETATAFEGVEMVKRLNPTCVVTDLALHGPGGLDTIRAVRADGYRGMIVVLTGNSDPSAMEAAIAAGADAYVLKQQTVERLTQVIAARELRPIATGVEPLVMAPPLGSGSNISRLTPREIEVFEGLVGGRSVKEIAFTLVLSPKTVEAHRAKLMLKLKVNNLADLTRLAMREGLLAP